jgi:hypothetical protein
VAAVRPAGPGRFGYGFSEEIMRYPRAPLFIVVALVVTAACSCGSPGSPAAGTPEPAAANPAGDIPDTTVYVPFRTPSGHVEVSVPQGWARTSDAQGVVFTDKLNSVRVQEIAAASAPTVASVRTTEVPKILSGAAHVAMGAVTQVQRKGGAAVQIAYLADSAPDAVTGKVIRDAVERYDFYWHGTEVVLTLSGPVGADNVDPWRTVTDSAAWLA